MTGFSRSEPTPKLLAWLNVLFCTRCPDPALLVPAGTWVTFGGQITDEVRTDGFCHFPSVRVQEWEPPRDLSHPQLTIFTKVKTN